MMFFFPVVWVVMIQFPWWMGTRCFLIREQKGRRNGSLIISFRNDEAKGQGQERETKKKKKKAMLCFPPQNEQSRGSGGIFLVVRGLIWVGSAADWNESSDIAALYNSIPGQMDKSFERTLSLILGPLMWCRILGCHRGFHIQIHSHSHTQGHTHRSVWFQAAQRDVGKNNREVRRPLLI